MKRVLLVTLLISLSVSSQNENKGVKYYEKGEYLKAAKAFEKALDDVDPTREIENPTYLGVLCLTAESFYLSEKNLEARKYYKLAIDIYESSPYHQKNFQFQRFAEGYLNVLLKISFKTFLEEDYKETELILMHCTKLRSKYQIENDQYEFTLHKALANLYGKIGKVDLYLDYSLKVITVSKKVFGEYSVQHMQELSNTAVALKTCGMFEDAMNIMETAFAIFLKLELDPLHPLVSHLLSVRASINIALKNLDQAEKDLKTVLEVLKRMKDLHMSYRNTFGGEANLSLGYVYHLKGNYEKSIEHYKSSLNSYGQIFNAEGLDIGGIKLNMAQSFDNNDNYEKAYKHYLEAFQIAQTNYENVYFGLSENEKFLYLNIKLIRYFYAFQSFAFKSQNKDPKLTGRVYNHILFIKNQLLESTVNLKRDLLNSGDILKKLQFEEWIQIKTKIAAIYERKKSDPKKINSLLQKANSIEKNLITKSEVFQKFKGNNKTWQDIKKSLKEDEVAIEFVDFNFYDKKWSGEPYYYALVIESNSLHPKMLFLCKESELKKILLKNTNNKKKGITSIYGTKNSKNTKLYNLIWKPLQEYTEGKSNVFFSPSGLLNNVSFSALSDGNQFLTNSSNLIRLASTSKISSPNYLVNNLQKISLYGGIQYGSNSSKWSFLDGTEEEVLELSKLFKSKNVNTQVFSGLNATEEKVKKDTDSQILHIATHGFFKEKEQSDSIIEYGEVLFDRGPFTRESLRIDKNPLLRSGLVFAGANDNENAILTSLEVTNLNLDKLNLVVLSACETGLGDIKGDEGVYGLQRSFKMAGVDYLIVSLWKVPDKETKEFMITFYKLLFQLGDIETAFNRTQQIMNQKYDPYYWGAFILIR